MTYSKCLLVRRFRYALETVFAYIAYLLFAIMPLDAASGFGGWIGRSIGPRLPSSDVARRNLAAAFPVKSAAELEEIVVGGAGSRSVPGRSSGQSPTNRPGVPPPLTTLEVADLQMDHRRRLGCGRAYAHPRNSHARTSYRWPHFVATSQWPVA